MFNFKEVWPAGTRLGPMRNESQSEDVLTVVSPTTGERLFRVTDQAVEDLRSHTHIFECRICHKTHQQIEEEQNGTA
jgi:hypothetical protein